MNNENTLQKYLTAQETSYTTALSEIKNGKKKSHWMWYIFPQIQGLGFSETSTYFSIKNSKEAEDYLRHEVLGERLLVMCRELLKLPLNDANKIFGSPDDLKLKSSMTLFSSLDVQPEFDRVLEKFFNGAKDVKTLEILSNR